MATGCLLVPLLLATVLRQPIAVDGGCAAAPQRALLQCSGADAPYFQRLSPNATLWIGCVACALPVIDARTFAYRRNMLSHLEITRSDTARLRRGAFGSLYVLRVLSLRGNRLQFLEPGCFEGLQRLLQLDLSLNSLQLLEEAAFGGLRSLDLLDLSDNRLETLHPQAFAGLARLQHLQLNRNALLRLQQRLFLPLQRLRVLFLEHNGLQHIHQEAFMGLAQLQHLYLNNNSIEFLLQYNFRPLAGLQQLQLRGNLLREVQVSAFNGLRRLRVLHLADNRVSDIKPYGLVGLDELRVLDLVRNRLRQVALARLDPLRHLQVLWLNDNPIGKLVVGARDAPLEALEVLDLSGSGLRVFDHASLLRATPRLRELVLANCSLECQFGARLAADCSAANVTLCLTSRCSPDDTPPVCPPTAPPLPAGASPLPPLRAALILAIHLMYYF